MVKSRERGVCEVASGERSDCFCRTTAAGFRFKELARGRLHSAVLPAYDDDVSPSLTPPASAQDLSCRAIWGALRTVWNLSRATSASLPWLSPGLRAFPHPSMRCPAEKLILWGSSIVWRQQGGVQVCPFRISPLLPGWLQSSSFCF